MVFDATTTRHSLTIDQQPFDMALDRFDCIRKGLIDSVTGRETTGQIGNRDAEIGILVLVDYYWKSHEFMVAIAIPLGEKCS